MKKLKKFFKFLPVVAIAFVSGLAGLLSNDQTSSIAYASDNLLLYTDSYTSELNPILYEFVNSNDSADVIGIYFSPFSCDVNYYENYDGLNRTRYGAFTQRIKYGLNISVSASLVNQFSIMNLPLRDFTLKTYFKDFVFVEKTQNSTHPGMSSIWRVSISYDIYIDDVYFDNVVSYASFSANSTLRTLDLSLYESNFSSPYSLYYSVDLTTELIANNMYQNGYSDGYEAGYDSGYGHGYSAGDVDGYLKGWDDGNVIGVSDGYNSGYDDGALTGYTSGFDDGSHSRDNDVIDAYNNGYASGYNEGFNSDSTVASIFSGILQVGMLPINVLLAIFNFEILGINLSAFISAILTVCLTIIVIRTIKGGGSSD